jgi:hypothetical protein
MLFHLDGDNIMFGMLESFTKATVGLLVETPIAVVADIATLGGVLTDKDKPYTEEALSKVVKNLNDTTS